MPFGLADLIELWNITKAEVAEKNKTIKPPQKKLTETGELLKKLETRGPLSEEILQFTRAQLNGLSVVTETNLRSKLKALLDQQSGSDWKTSTVWVPQRCAGAILNYRSWTGNKSACQFLGTFGMAPCVGLVLYEAETQSGLVAHFDNLASTEIMALRAQSHAVYLQANYDALMVAVRISRAFAKKIGKPTSALQAWIVKGSGPEASSHEILGELDWAMWWATKKAPRALTSGDIILNLTTGEVESVMVSGAGTNNTLSYNRLQVLENAGLGWVRRLDTNLQTISSYHELAPDLPY